MYTTVKGYYEFLKELKKQKEEKLSMVIDSVNEQMTNFMLSRGWVRKGKGKKMFFTKNFNGKDIVIEYRCNYNDGFVDGASPEFVHDKSVPNTIERLQMEHFHWNDERNSGWSLDEVMERMEVFYNKYTS